MEWSSSDFGDSRKESNEFEVLKFLQPPENLKKLVIACYNGLEFPNWVGDHDHPFSKMEQLSLRNCKKCAQLPPLGRLPLLRELYIEGMDEIECIGDELYGEIENPFPSLECLVFDNMPKWKDWKEREAILFPCLAKLRITKCPELINLPNQLLLSSMKELHIDECPRLEANEYKTGSSLKYLYIGGISRPSCLQEGFAQSVTTLEILRINQCDDLPFPALESLASLRHLEIRKCDEVVFLEEQKLPCNLETLIVDGCSKVDKLPDELGSLTSITKLVISNCSKLVSFPATGFPTGLRGLTVKDCESLKSLPDGIMNSSCCLKHLFIKGCPSLCSFPEGELPATLKCLHIIECDGLKHLPEGIICDLSTGSSNTRGLQTLDVLKCPSLTSIPKGEFPSTLVNLTIWDCEKLESMPGKMLQNLTSLQFLNICNCPEVVSAPEVFLTTNLKFLAISECKNMKRPLSEWGLQALTSLTHFSFTGPFSDVISFSDGHGSQLFLPASLKELQIHYFPSLKSVASMGFQSLISLEILGFNNCPKLVSLVPKEGLPPTIVELTIIDCPVLKKRCLKDKGKDGPRLPTSPEL